MDSAICSVTHSFIQSILFIELVLRLCLSLYQEDITTRNASASAKPIDLQKIFTPASDAQQIQPQKNRKCLIQFKVVSDVRI